MAPATAIDLPPPTTWSLYKSITTVSARTGVSTTATILEDKTKQMPKRFGTSTEVQNINGTGGADWTDGNPYNIPRLPERYFKCTGTARAGCCAVGCSNPFQATAHVLINDGSKGGGTRDWWLVPTCSHHNTQKKDCPGPSAGKGCGEPHKNQCFEVNPGTVFATVAEVRDM